MKAPPREVTFGVPHQARAQALLRGRAWVAQLWAKSVGAVRLRALPLFFGAAGVSPCRREPLRAGCCGGEGVLGVS